MTRNDLDLTADIIDVRDIIARIEDLQEQFGDITIEERDELEHLRSIMEDLKGAGGDEQWEGEWYPLILIRASYFKDYAQELAEECGMVNSQATWPNNCIDWDMAARDLKHDYTATDISGTTYYFR